VRSFSLPTLARPAANAHTARAAAREPRPNETLTFVNPLRGIALKVLSVTVFTTMAMCIKAVAPAIPPGEAVFFRSSFAIPVILAWLVSQHDLRHGLDTAHPMGHLWRGLVGTTAMGLGFTALGLLPLPEATAIGYAAPLLTVIFAAMFLGEQVRVFRLSAVFVGLAGVVVVLSPRLSLAELGAASTLEAVGAFAALLAAVFAALAQVFVRKLVQTERTPAIVFYFSVTAAMLSLATLPFGWAWPSPVQAALLVGAGLLGGIGQILLTESYRHAETSVIAPFEYVSMVLALVFGYALFGEVPTRPMLTGAALIVAAGLFILWRERRLGIQRAGSRRVMTPQG
jgi:drug/metabolite transporter (DMT)-like permease